MLNEAIRLAAWLAVLALLASRPLRAEDFEVSLFRRAFLPTALTVRTGDTVTWKREAGDHVITSGESSSPEDNPGELFEAVVDELNPTFSFRFEEPGEFSFFDALNELAGGVGSVTVSDDSDTFRVGVVDNVFIPENIAIFERDTIHWQHEPMEAFHTVTSGRSSASEDNPGELFDEESSDAIPSFFYTFGDAGFYPYFCRPHEHLDMMGSVLVQRRFVRGDFNFDASADIGDVVGILFHVFIRNSEIPCLDAGDVNDNGAVDLEDAIHLLSHLFVDEVAIPRPHPRPGPDRTDDGMLCE